MKIKPLASSASSEFCPVLHHFDQWQALTDEARDLILDCSSWIVKIRIHELDGRAGWTRRGDAEFSEESR
jgi:hypothetical protein